MCMLAHVCMCVGVGVQEKCRVRKSHISPSFNRQNRAGSGPFRGG